MINMRLFCRKGIRTHSKHVLLLTIVFCSFFFVCPFIGLAGDTTQVTTVIIPINMAFPLLPTITIIANNPGASGGSVLVIDSGSQGIVGIIRVCGRD
jgi:hypothetical protein